MIKQILCYGDSNTWGFVPKIGDRYPDNIRWTGVAGQILGEDYHIWENGINGRTTIYDDPVFPCRNGQTSLDYALLASKPLDLIVLSLGTNDLKFTDVKGSRRGVERLIREILSANSRLYTDTSVFPHGVKILLLSPIRIHKQVETIDPDTRFGGTIPEESDAFPEQFKAVADLFPEVSFLDASVYVVPSQEDGIHMDAESHQRLGVAVAEKIQEIFQGTPRTP